MGRRLKALLLVTVIVICLLPVQTKRAKAGESVVSRDDGVWYFPGPQYTFNDWAGCNSTGCVFHPGVVHYSPGCHTTYNSGAGGHNGVDIYAWEGATVKAASKGRVVHYDYLGARGWTMILEHPIGDTGSSYYSVYQHLSGCILAVGDTCNPGTPIAYAGNTGASQGAHLHFSIIRGQSNRFSLTDASYLNLLESYGWVTTTDPNHGYGMIVTNPKEGDTNETGANMHCGSVSYTFTIGEVTDWTVGQYPFEELSVSEGNYTANQATVIKQYPYDASSSVKSLPNNAHVIVDGKVKNKYNNICASKRHMRE